MAMFIRYPNYFGNGRDLIDWNPVEMTGYEPKTTYYSDFSIAEAYGVNAIKDTYRRAIKYWGTDIEWMTEIAMVLNWKSWEHSTTDSDLANLYAEMYYDHAEWVNEHFSGDDLAYYYRTTD